MLLAFFINVFVLITATCFLYSLNEEAKMFGFGYTGLLMLIFSIPIITWINFFILQFVRKRNIF